MPKNPPYFASRGPANPGEIIANANAPIVTIEIILDNRFNPPKMSWKASHDIPGPIAMECVLNVAQTINRLMILEISGQSPVKGTENPPNLPPAPAS